MITILNINKISEEISVLENLINQMQAECPHPQEHIIEAPFTSSFYSTRYPFIVCKMCGYAEEGWGCGYWKLDKPNIPTLDRKLAYEYVLKMFDQEKLSELRYQREMI